MYLNRAIKGKKMSFFFSHKDIMSIFRELLQPSALYEKVEDIPLEELAYKGFNTLLLDVDNTILPFNARAISLQKRSWIKKAKTLNMKVYLLSNNSKQRRIERVAQELDTTGLFFAMKPSPCSVSELMRDKNINPDQAIVIGDQLLTDVILGKWLKLYTILVDPIDKSSSFGKTMQRDIELYLLNKMQQS